MDIYAVTFELSISFHSIQNWLSNSLIPSTNTIERKYNSDIIIKYK